jgi:hypothetical protein
MVCYVNWLDGKAYIFEVMGSSPVQTTKRESVIKFYGIALVYQTLNLFLLVYRWKLIPSIHVAGSWKHRFESYHQYKNYIVSYTADSDKIENCNGVENVGSSLTGTTKELWLKGI